MKHTLIISSNSAPVQAGHTWLPSILPLHLNVMQNRFILTPEYIEIAPGSTVTKTLWKNKVQIGTTCERQLLHLNPHKNRYMMPFADLKACILAFRTILNDFHLQIGPCSALRQVSKCHVKISIQLWWRNFPEKNQDIAVVASSPLNLSHFGEVFNPGLDSNSQNVWEQFFPRVQPLHPSGPQ